MDSLTNLKEFFLYFSLLQLYNSWWWCC